MLIKRSRREKFTFRVFYLLVAYMLAQICWWGFKLAEVHRQMLELKTIVTGINQYEELQRKYLMIAGEGMAFLIIFAIAVYIIFRNLRTEFARTEREKTFLLSTSHELRTPLTTVNLVLQTLQRPQLPEDKRLELIGNALNETSRLQWLTENILLASRIDSLETNASAESCALSDIIGREIHTGYGKMRFGDRLKVEIESEGVVHGDRQMLVLLLSNLVDNAFKYAPAGSPVTIRLFDKNGHPAVTVTDMGPGIPKEDLPNIYDKFYRGGREEVRQHKGTGLGLYLVREIARLHRARVQYHHQSPTGSIFEIEFVSA
ncbi:MAG: HAMP domain-containing histidine kinase [Flavobacteriales bacterium]|nr:HAMP domain-containing histidine kinase [Flavobacteriales bacterium]